MARSGILSSSSVQDVLQQVLNEKIHELKTQKTTLQAYYKALREESLKQTDDPIARIRTLYEGIKYSPVPQSTRKVVDGLPLFLKTAGDDPSCSAELCQHWLHVLDAEIQFALAKCEYAYIFGRIMQEDRKVEDDDGDSESWSEVGGSMSEREKTIQELEARVFAPPSFDRAAFEAFLKTEILNGDNIEVHEVLRNVQAQIKRGLDYLVENSISTHDLGWCIDGLLATDLMNEEKRRTLSWLKDNQTSLKEVASLLTNRLRKLKEWQWPASGVNVDVRRSMNGKHRAFLDEDIPTALFLQFIGVRFCTLFKENLTTIFNSRIWKRSAGCMDENSIENVRYDLHAKNFMSLLPSTAQQQASTAYKDDDDTTTSAFNVKNSLLHQLNAEAKLHRVISPSDSFTVVRTDLQWFGPSIPHEAIQAMLEFVGVPEIWQSFIRRYLEVPLVFEQGQEPRVRKCGVPIAHPLSNVCGESLLFLMDLYVNQTSGVTVQRVHDDFWFWDKNEDVVCKTWEAMQRFADLAALKFNMAKSGSAKVLTADEDVKLAEGESGPSVFGKEPLPQATVRWGSLVFHSDAVFRINYSSLKPHIEDQKRQLRLARTVMEWVNVYNRFLAFYIHSFGRFARVFGVQHLEQMSKAMKWIHTQVFSEHGGNPLAALKFRFEVFRDVSIPDMWAYWPLELGGLGLRNVFLDISPLREAVADDAGNPKQEEHFFVRLPERDAIAWEEETKRAEEETMKGARGWTKAARTASEPETFESYCSKRESGLSHWRKEYLRALEIPDPDQSVVDKLPHEVWTEVEDEVGVDDAYYALRLMLYYGNQMELQFGTLQFISPELIPRSMIYAQKGAAIKWEE